MSIRPDDQFDSIAYPEKRTAIHIEELDAELETISEASTLESLSVPEEYPLILQAGMHSSLVADLLQRNPEGNRKRRQGIDDYLLVPQIVEQFFVWQGSTWYR